MEPLIWYVALFLLGLLVLGLGLRLYFIHTESDGNPPIDSDALLNAFTDPVVVLDVDETVLMANTAFRSMFHENPAGLSISNVLSDQSRLLQLVRDEQTDEVTFETGDGSNVYVVRHYAAGSGRREDYRQVVFLQDMTGERERQKELESQTKRLQEFAGFISHDLRNPLDIAIGRTNAMEGKLDDPELETQHRETQEAHRRMRHVISGLLTLAQEGKTLDSLEPVDLQEIAREAWSYVETDSATMNTTEPVTFLADRHSVARIFENLFRNAIEHGGDSVEVTVGPLDTDEGFFVADDGRGIPPEERERVTRAGYSNRQHGTGLGLSIVTEIATAHGWDVDITTSEAGGARFEFTGVELVSDEIATTEVK